MVSYGLFDKPGTQLTASFNPIFEDPIDWYKDNYYPPWTLKTMQYRPDINVPIILLLLKPYLIQDIIFKIIELYDWINY
jgi:hypothetical protein